LCVRCRRRQHHHQQPCIRCGPSYNCQPSAGGGVFL
jgi:hypothetical protein